VGWALCQNWQWAKHVWPGSDFNFWRCWESSGGISIGIAYGLAYYLVNRTISPEESAERLANARPNRERFGLYLGLLFGLGFSIKNGLKGWANIYLGNEEYWEKVFWIVIGSLTLIALVAVVRWIRSHPIPRGFQGDLFPHAYAIMWIVLITQNVIAQMVTGPHKVWSEVVFAIYYLLLFLISATIISHYQSMKTNGHPLSTAQQN
jgi:hypothetical protein